MEREKDKSCPYLDGRGEGAVCRLIGCGVREIRFADFGFCLGNHTLCRVYRRHSDDYIAD